MSLTVEDLGQIRTLVHEVVYDAVRPLEKKIDDLSDKIETLENDIKEIYFMIVRLEKGVITDKSFKRLSVEEKLLKLNAELLAAAKEAGITLPR